MSADPSPALAERLLAEWVRQQEEAAGHPFDVPEADAAAIQAGGSLARRIATRAAGLPEAGAMRSGIDRALTSGRWLIAVVLLLSALSGAAAASAALSATQPASLPLVLLVMVGANLFTLLLWLLMQWLTPRLSVGLSRWLRLGWQWVASRRPPMASADAGTARSVRMPAQDAMQAALGMLGQGNIGRWLLGSVVHAAWLAFTLSGLVTLALLLSVRSYEWSWATTLLDADTVAAWARALSGGPLLLGVPAEALSLDNLQAAPARQAWSWWLLAAVLAYGVIPRLLALAACVLLLRRGLVSLGCDLRLPGYARLRTRLQPEHQGLGVFDAAPPKDDTRHPLAAMVDAWPQGRVHGAWIDGDDEVTAPPPIAGVHWIWLGNAEGVAGRSAQLHALQGERVETLLVLVRATMSPDRGIARHLAALSTASAAPARVLVLARYEALQARGAEACARRLEDWRALAASAGAGVLCWSRT